METLIAVWTDARKRKEFAILCRIAGDPLISCYHESGDEQSSIDGTDRLIIYDPIQHTVQVRERTKGNESVSALEPLGHMLVVKEVPL